MVLITQATSNVSGKPAHSRSLTRAFAVHTLSMEVDNGSNQKSDISPHWMAAHVHLKNEFTEDGKYQSRMSWLKCVCPTSSSLSEAFSSSIPHVSEQRRLWQNWAHSPEPLLVAYVTSTLFTLTSSKFTITQENFILTNIQANSTFL